MKIILVNNQIEKDAKEIEISEKILAYKAAQEYQVQNGGPGPVADYDVMEIVNEHNDMFSVIIREVPIDEPIE